MSESLLQEITAFSFSQTLRVALDERIKRNRRYSLRAFARDLDISPSHLSEMMNGSAMPSFDSVRQICRHLEFSKELTERTCDLFEAKNCKIEWRQRAAEDRLRQAESDRSLYLYNDDQSRAISHPVHFTILSYLELSDPPRFPRELAVALGESEAFVIAALARLERIGAISYQDDGSVMITRTRTRIGDGVAPEAQRTFHREFCDFILQSMVHHAREKKHMDGIIFAISREAVDEFRQILTDTRRRLTEVSKKYDKKDAVYYVNLQMTEAKKTWSH